jgi:heavy metal sensor kinase
VRGLTTIRARITALCVAVLAASLAASALAAYGVFSRMIWQRHDDELESTVETVETAFQTGIRVEGGNEFEAAHHMLNELHFPNYRIGLFTSDGQPFAARPGPNDHPEHVHAPAVEIAPEEVLRIARDAGLDAAGRPYVFATRETPQGPSRFVLTEITSESSGSRFFIAAEEPNAGVEATLSLLRTTLLVIAPFFVVVAGAGGWTIARRSLAPVAAMSERAREIGAENLGDRLPVANERDELGVLARAFNDLLDRLEREFDRMRQFTADASHELRTPLAVLKGEAQVALRREREAAEYRESLEVILEETSHMARLVEDMFTLARADAGDVGVDLRPVDLDDLVADCCRATRALAKQKGIDLAAEPEAIGVEAVGDEALLRRAVVNLLDNAIKYTGPGGRVRARVALEDGWARVEVSDTGIGICEADRERIFERFYRADKARSRTEGGAGLGLSIVRWVVAAHGGRLDVRSEPGHGSAFSVLLPARRVPVASRV